MKKKILIALGMLITLSGCASNNDQVGSISSAYITENHIPFPHKTYQREPATIHMKEVTYTNDFVQYKTTSQYVIWKAEPAEEIQVPESDAFIEQVAAITPEMKNYTPGCRVIINDLGQYIGEVKVCEHGICDEELAQRYECPETDDACTMKLIGEKLCEEMPDHPFCAEEQSYDYPSCAQYGELLVCSKKADVCGFDTDK
jgi:hypothetical protein